MIVARAPVPAERAVSLVDVEAETPSTADAGPLDLTRPGSNRRHAALTAETVKHPKLHVWHRRTGQRRSDRLNEPNDLLGARMACGVELLPTEILCSGDSISTPGALLEIPTELGEHVVTHLSSNQLRCRWQQSLA